MPPAARCAVVTGPLPIDLPPGDVFRWLIGALDDPKSHIATLIVGYTVCYWLHVKPLRAECHRVTDCLLKLTADLARIAFEHMRSDLPPGPSPKL